MQDHKNRPSPELLRQLLSYDPGTGRFTWLERGIELFGSKRAWASWNAKNAGNEAFVTKTTNGYLGGRILGRNYTGHRIAWTIQHGSWPASSEEIDHINGDPADNRIENLRLVSHQENGRNMGARKSKSGTPGVDWRPMTGKWRARICSDGRSHHLGNFTTKEGAIEARQKAAASHGFHENHGKRPSLSARHGEAV